MTIRETIVATFGEVAKEQNRSLPPLTDDVKLLKLDLDSLCMAVIVARLEASLGADPFSSGDNVVFPTSFGDFVALYENAG